MFYFFRATISAYWLSFSDSYSVFVNFVLHFIDKINMTMTKSMLLVNKASMQMN